MRGIKLVTVLVVMIATMAFVVPMESVMAYRVGIEWISDWTRPGFNDLPYADNDARGFYNKLGRRGWTRSYECGDNAAWDIHFEEDDGNWADTVDFVYVSTHGGSSGFYFNNVNHDNGKASRSEIADGNPLGNGNLEWMALNACKIFYSEWWKWIFVFAGLHQIQSFRSTTYDNPWYGRIYACEMVNDLGIFDYEYTTRAAWHVAALKIFGWGGPLWFLRVRTGVMGADNAKSNTWNDHLWGEGWVSPDPTNPTKFWLESISA